MMIENSRGNGASDTGAAAENSLIASLPPGFSAEESLRSNSRQRSSEKWWKMWLATTRSYGPPSGTLKTSPSTKLVRSRRPFCSTVARVIASTFGQSSSVSCACWKRSATVSPYRPLPQAMSSTSSVSRVSAHGARTSASACEAGVAIPGLDRANVSQKLCSGVSASCSRTEPPVRTGGSVLEQDAETPEHSFWETFARSSPGIATPASHALAEVLAPWAETRETLEVLDIACGSGLYGLTVAERFQHAQLTLLDWPNVLAITRATVEQKGLLDRTSFVEGDVFSVPLGGPYDLVVASHIFHHFSEERCLELLRRLSSALKPGGRLAINEFSAAAPVSEEPFPRLFSIIMLVWTQEGEAYPVETYRRWLEATGFSPPEVHQGAGMPSRFLI